jgi:hypothetical protein
MSTGEEDIQQFGAPVLAVCGFSGSGKTTLLEAAIPHLIARGLAVAAIKHDSHGFVVDKEGKDSDRLFRAGATVALRGPGEQFLRRGFSSVLTLEATLSDKNQPSMWIKRRPAFKSDGQPNPEMSKSAATNARPVRNNEVHQQC